MSVNEMSAPFGWQSPYVNPPMRSGEIRTSTEKFSSAVDPA